MAAYGGFWRRVLAYFIDAILLNIAGGMLGGVLGLSMGLGMMSGMTDVTALETVAAMSGGLLGLLLGWLYSALLESSSMQATLGKKALGMIVTDLEGGRISFARATGRYFAKILSAAVLLIGFIMVAFTQRKQGLHDILASTLVYKANSSADVTTQRAVFE